MNKSDNVQRIEQAVEAGLALTDPDSDLLDVFRKQGTGVLLLRSLLGQMATGEIGLIPKAELEELKNAADDLKKELESD